MDQIKRQQPLAERMRPQSLDEFIGQQHIVGPDSYLRKAIESDQVNSMILWGPPGCGKTTLATIIAKETKADFVILSAVNAGKKDLRLVIERAKQNRRLQIKTILFIDEIHRWNKAQQDALLPHVEQGVITLIGATTENPSFEVNSALLSRSRVFVLEKLAAQDIAALLAQTLKNNRNGLGSTDIIIAKETIALIARFANGDGRAALNILELAVDFGGQEITEETVKEVVQKTHVYYDKDGEEHYNIISALHKSMRGNDANASVYWLARMLEGGEDPLYIARRLIRFASEDIGNADPQALVLAVATFDACHKMGMPECNVVLAQCVLYLAAANKDITAYEAYSLARKDVITHGNLPVPLHIRNAPTNLMKDLGYGKGYKYTPELARRGESTVQQYLPKKLQNRRYVE